MAWNTCSLLLPYLANIVTWHIHQRDQAVLHWCSANLCPTKSFKFWFTREQWLAPIIKIGVHAIQNRLRPRNGLLQICGFAAKAAFAIPLSLQCKSHRICIAAVLLLPSLSALLNLLRVHFRKARRYLRGDGTYSGSQRIYYTRDGKWPFVVLLRREGGSWWQDVASGDRKAARVGVVTREPERRLSVPGPSASDSSDVVMDQQQGRK